MCYCDQCTSPARILLPTVRWLLPQQPPSPPPWPAASTVPSDSVVATTVVALPLQMRRLDGERGLYTSYLRCIADLRRTLDETYETTKPMLLNMIEQSLATDLNGAHLRCQPKLFQAQPLIGMKVALDAQFKRFGSCMVGAVHQGSDIDMVFLLDAVLKSI